MKRQYLKYFLCLTFILFFGIIYSCRKDKTKITINGTVYDPNSNAYVIGANVTISASGVSSGYYNSSYTDIATTTTDANGKFTFHFDKEKSAGYRIYISKSNYFDNTIDVSGADLEPGIPYSPTYNLNTKAFIKLRVKNALPNNSNDQIIYSYSSGYLSCYECCSNTNCIGYGVNYDSTLTCKTYGNQNVIIFWHSIKGSGDVLHYDTIYCSAFDTTNFQILY